jgi:beta-galactosidase
MKSVLRIHIAMLTVSATLLFPTLVCAQRTVEDFNAGWRFAKGEHDASVQQVDFDDSTWEKVNLPHDWAISGPFDPNEDGYAGKLPWRGVGWYRKTFRLDGIAGKRRVYFDFDGVMAFPRVYVNGQLAGQWDYGYMSFRVDATPYIRPDANNVIAVEADTRQHGTRWYPGAGIYRKVTMTICNPVHLAQWGTYVTTPQVSDASATVRIRSTIDNHLDTDSQITLEVMILDAEGRAVAKGHVNSTVPAGASRELDQSLTILKPQRWDVTGPYLYAVKTLLRTDREILDMDSTPFGVRTFEFTADDGFHLNGHRVQLYGVCLHHDHGPLGAAFYTRAMERQLEIMRDTGVNAIRMSHNPPAPEALDLCDRMGFVVWDEVFDKWDRTADRVDDQPPLEQYGEKQIRSLALRDRNHPSVVVWSIGNEVNNRPYDREGKSPERVKFMSDFFRKYDPTRPVGMACHIPETANEPILDALDLTGWNYARRYARYRQRYPDNPIIYSESASTLSTRGFYDLPLPTRKTEYSDDAHQVSSYDLNAATWSDVPEVEFLLMENDRFVAGEFVWTGFDYLGEPTPFTQEARSSYFGIVDLCGIPKDRYYLYRSYWRPDTATIHILPHWNWPDRVGQNVPVMVYTNGDSAELFLNGQSLGARTKGPVPQRPASFALDKAATARSSEPNHAPEHACDGVKDSRWTAADGQTGQWWQVDLGEVQPIRYLGLEFEREEKNYGYEIKVSADASDWQTVVTKPTSRMPMYGGPTQIFHGVDVEARYVRIEFTALQDNVRASLQEFGAYPKKIESDYYDPTYKYRLRWNNVVYEPGELKVVAYKNGRKIGEEVCRTAGAPTALRLTPDRTKLVATGQDLSYILVEAVDAKGTICPLADNLVRFSVEGAVEIAGVGNGNPLSVEPFQANSRKLFYGKAMLILRSIRNRTGHIRVTASSDGLRSAVVALDVSH